MPKQTWDTLVGTQNKTCQDEVWNILISPSDSGPAVRNQHQSVGLGKACLILDLNVELFRWTNLIFPSTGQNERGKRGNNNNNTTKSTLSDLHIHLYNQSSLSSRICFGLRVCFSRMGRVDLS